jgi:ketosteroid isomerase-like protein
MELVRSIYAAWERGDFRSAEWADPEIEFVWADGPAPGSWKGLAGMAEGTVAWLSAWEDHHATPEQYREVDSERVLVLIKLSGRGKSSGVELASMYASAAHLFEVHDGKVTRFVFYFDRGHALADLGLAAQNRAR